MGIPHHIFLPAYQEKATQDLQYHYCQAQEGEKKGFFFKSSITNSYIQMKTVYIAENTHNEIKQIAMEEKKDIKDIAKEAFDLYLKNRAKRKAKAG